MSVAPSPHGMAAQSARHSLAMLMTLSYKILSTALIRPSMKPATNCKLAAQRVLGTKHTTMPQASHEGYRATTLSRARASNQPGYCTPIRTPP